LALEDGEVPFLQYHYHQQNQASLPFDLNILHCHHDPVQRDWEEDFPNSHVDKMISIMIGERNLLHDFRMGMKEGMTICNVKLNIRKIYGIGVTMTLSKGIGRRISPIPITFML
jgi:hypothetical protein